MNVVELRPRPPAPRRRRLTTAQRRDLYEDARGDNEFPFCNICGLEILPGQKWEESHEGAPHALGGTRTGVAHRRCNREHGAKIVTPMVAEAKREYDRHRDIWRSRNPLPGGKDDPLHRKRTLDGRVVNRRTGEPWPRGKT